MRTLITGGKLVSASGITQNDILIEGEKIIAIGKNLGTADNTVNAKGKIIFPGFIDAHTHLDFEVSNTVTADDFESGTISALYGGTTTIVDFVTPDKGEGLISALNRWQTKAENKAKCDYRFHMTVCDWSEKISSELEKMQEHGISSFKMYMCYDGVMIDDTSMLNALVKIHELGGISAVHCENRSIVNYETSKLKAEGKFDSDCHPISRPDLAEAEAVSRLCYLAEYANVPIIIVHLSSEFGLNAVKEARARGVKVYVETCPQYLFLDDEVFTGGGLKGALAVCAPPIRKKSDNLVLWTALASGEIDTICTDHCSFTAEQKTVGLEDFCKIPGGLPGLETRGILLYDAVANGKISPEIVCKVLCENPAKIYGMYPQKGTISVGSDADLVIINPEKSTKIKASNLHSKANYTPFEGLNANGTIEKVFLRGNMVIENGNYYEKTTGLYVK